MEYTDLMNIRTSLNQAMEAWIEANAENDEWNSLNTFIGDATGPLMAEAAFNILLAQKSLSEYLRANGIEAP